MLRSTLMAALLAVAVAAPSIAVAQSPKIAIVDVEKVMMASDHWKSAVDVLKADLAQRQAALEKRKEELAVKREKLDAQRAISDPNTFAKQEEAFYGEAQELSGQIMKGQQELSAREQKLTEQMLARVEAIVRDLAAAGEYDFVFETGTKDMPSVLYSQKSLDITPKVIAEYQKRFKDKPLDLTPPKAAASKQPAPTKK
ncbi:OmpH family outer membrane protein [Myxococcota bacterium]|nr:OmpH family outer membrane protein [Myxococcota bacterium]